MVKGGEETPKEITPLMSGRKPYPYAR